MPDNELAPAVIERARRGERAAQDAFMRRYVGPLHALVRRAGVDGDPDDATQELLGKLLRVLPRFDPEGPARLTTWVFTVAQRAIVDLRRKRQLVSVPLSEGAAIADERPGAEALLERRDLAGALEEEIARLPEAQRRVFVLSQVHGQALTEVAAGEGVAVGTVKSRLHRARAALAEALRPIWQAEGAKHGQGG